MASYANTNSENLVSITTDSSHYNPKPAIIEDIVIAAPIEYSEIFTLVESLLIGSPSTTSVTFKTSILNAISTLSSLSVLYPQSLIDTIVASEGNSNILHKVAYLTNNFIINSSEVSSTEFYTLINDLTVLITSLDKVIHGDITDNISLTQTLNVLYKLSGAILDLLNVSSTNISSLLFFSNIESAININSNPLSKAILNSLVHNSLLIKIGSDVNDVYLAYLLSPETNSVSTYSNYNFNGCTKFGYKYLFYNRTGLYEYGGSSDNLDPIRSEIETVAFNFQTSNLKQVPSIYLGVDSTDKVILKVRVDGKAEVHYQLNKFTNNLMTQKIDIGKGLIGRYFQFELITEASEFSMESIEFYPLEIRRKL